MNLECKVKKAISKAGNEYIYISIMIGKYEKKVFLEKAEEAILAMTLNETPQK